MIALGGIPPDLRRFARGVIREKLPNGATILVVPRRFSATAHFAIAFVAGGVDEPEGRSGIAHLLEHMAFKGTERIGTRNWAREKPLLARLDALDAEIRAETAKGAGSGPGRLKRLRTRFEQVEKKAEALGVASEFDELYSRNGARGLNAYTSKDATVYIVNLPANRTPLWAITEAQRLKRPVMRQFHRERNVVLEELRRYDDMPNWRLLDSLPGLAFSAHPYRIPVIGWQSDLERMTRPDLVEFFRAHYRPEKAVLAAVGDVHPGRLLKLIRREFGPWRAPVPAPRPITTAEPEQRGERRAVQHMQSNPLLGMAWPIPTWGHPDKPALDALAAIFSRGDSSRLHVSLVKRKRIAVAVQAMTEFPGERYPNLFAIVAVPRAPHSAEESERAIEEEIGRLARGGPSRREIEKVANLVESDIFQRLGDSSGLAAALAHTEAVCGDWSVPLRSLREMRELGPADISRVTREYLIPAKRNVLVIGPREPA